MGTRLRNLNKLFLIRAAVVVTLLQPVPGVAGAKSLYLDVMNTLQNICSVYDLGRTVSDAFANIGGAISVLDDGISNFPNTGPYDDMPPEIVRKERARIMRDRGKKGEEAIRNLHKANNFDFIEQIHYSVVGERTERVVDFLILGKDGVDYGIGERVYIEAKNVAELSDKNLKQILDYPHGKTPDLPPTRTIVAMRNRAKIDQKIKNQLLSLSKTGVLTVVECAFAL